MSLLRQVMFQSTFRQNPFLSISLGNNPLKYKNNFKIFVNNYLGNYKPPLTFVICDYIGYHNYLAFHNSKNSSSAKRMALNEGDQIRNLLKPSISELPTDINVFNWKDIHNQAYHNKINIVQHHYDTNPEFKKEINSIATEFAIRRRPDFSFKPKSFNSIVQYIIWELPMFLCGISINNINYNTCLYPSWENVTIGIGNIGKDIVEKKKFTALYTDLDMTRNKCNFVVYKYPSNL